MALPWPAGHRPLMGVIHLPPLPGTPRHGGGGVEPALAQALADLAALEAGGADGAIVENFGDAPFRKKAEPVTVAAMAIIVRGLAQRASIPLGVNVLRSDGPAALAIAALAGAAFIRVNVFSGVAFTDQGAIEGEARAILDLRRVLGAEVAVFADVHVKHAVHLDSLEAAARDAARNGPDALIVTGGGTGEMADPGSVVGVQAAAGVPVFVGSGITPENLPLFARADGWIVGTFLKMGGKTAHAVDANRVRALVQARNRLIPAEG